MVNLLIYDKLATDRVWLGAILSYEAPMVDPGDRNGLWAVEYHVILKFHIGILQPQTVGQVKLLAVVRDGNLQAAESSTQADLRFDVGVGLTLTRLIQEPGFGTSPGFFGKRHIM